jgi:hypothetical protein
MPGAELPQQRTMAPEPQAPEKPDFFAPRNNPALTDYTQPIIPGATAFAFPKGPGTIPGDTTASSTETAPPAAETPLFTTTEGGTTGDDTLSAYDTK